MVRVISRVGVGFGFVIGDATSMTVRGAMIWFLYAAVSCGSEVDLGT